MVNEIERERVGEEERVCDKEIKRETQRERDRNLDR